MGITFLMFFSGAAFCEKSYDYIDITDPGFKKTPIAVSVFKAITHGPKEQEICEDAYKLLSDTLEFTGHFKLIDRGAFSANPESMGIEKKNIRFKDWTAIGAEYLITGGVLISGNSLSIELRMFDTLKQTGVEGLELRYTDRLEDNSIRRIIHAYFAHVIAALFREQGIFNSNSRLQPRLSELPELDNFTVLSY